MRYGGQGILNAVQQFLESAGVVGREVAPAGVKNREADAGAILGALTYVHGLPVIAGFGILQLGPSVLIDDGMIFEAFKDVISGLERGGVILVYADPIHPATSPVRFTHNRDGIRCAADSGERFRKVGTREAIGVAVPAKKHVGGRPGRPEI